MNNAPDSDFTYFFTLASKMQKKVFIYLFS